MGHLNSGADPYRQFLATQTCYDLLPRNGNVAMLDTKLTVRKKEFVETTFPVGNISFFFRLDKKLLLHFSRMRPARRPNLEWTWRKSDGYPYVNGLYRNAQLQRSGDGNRQTRSRMVAKQERKRLQERGKFEREFKVYKKKFAYAVLINCAVF